MSPMQRALGKDWELLPPALQAHHQSGDAADVGFLDIDYPRFMQPVLTVLRLLGILLDRRGQQVATTVEKRTRGPRQDWRRAITYPDGTIVGFNSCWVHAGGNEIIEFVNPLLGLQMAVSVAKQRLHYRGIRFVVKLGPVRLPLPQWMALGQTTIVEAASGDRSFSMDFRMRHPWFGEVFRYSGTFEAAPVDRRGCGAGPMNWVTTSKSSAGSA